MTKNIQISLRLTPYQLAHGLEIIQAIEPVYQPTSLSAMVKLIYVDYLAKMSIVSNPFPSPNTQQTIKRMSGRSVRGKDKNQDKDQELLTKIVLQRLESATPTSIKSLSKELNQNLHSAHSMEAPTKSTNKIVTDFSPPTLEELPQPEDNNNN